MTGVFVALSTIGTLDPSALWMRVILSKEPVATLVPSGLNATDDTVLVSLRARVEHGQHGIKTYTVLSHEPAAIFVPSAKCDGMQRRPLVPSTTGVPEFSLHERDARLYLGASDDLYVHPG